MSRSKHIVRFYPCDLTVTNASKNSGNALPSLKSLRVELDMKAIHLELQQLLVRAMTRVVNSKRCKESIEVHLPIFTESGNWRRYNGLEPNYTECNAAQLRKWFKENFPGKKIHGMWIQRRSTFLQDCFVILILPRIAVTKREIASDVII